MAGRGQFLVLLLLLLQSSLTLSAIHRLLVRLEPGVTHCTALENLLTETSEQLYNVTRGRVQWDRVTFLLPRNYTTDCVFSSNQPRRVQTKSRRTDRHLAEVVVGGDHPLLADLPWADQFYGGCGVPGRGVHLSRSFISSFSPSNSFLQGRKVLREWVKHRYGVFDERGFEGDAQYHGGQDNTCATFRNQTISVEIEDPNGTNNTTDDEDHHHEPTGGGRRVLVRRDEVKVTAATSILATLDAEDFCAEENHIRWIPTKHNLLCDEKSIWQVMNAHPDFLMNPSSSPAAPYSSDEVTTDLPADDENTPFFPPEFEYVSPALDRYVLVLDRSQTSAQSNRWTLVRRSLYRWIHALPNGTYLSIIISSGAGQETSPTLPWTRVTADNRDGLLGRIPRRPSSQPHQLSSAIQLAHQLLSDEEEPSCCGGQLVLVLSGDGSSSLNLGPSESAQIAAIHTIVFPSQEAKEVVIPDSSTTGLHVAVPDFDGEPSLAQSRLTSALLQVLRYSSGSPSSAPIQVYEETLTAGTDQDQHSGGRFTLDSPLAENVWVVAHVEDEADLDTVEVLSPSGRIYDLPLVSDGMLHIRIPRTDEFGEWSYRLRFSPPVSSSSPSGSSQNESIPVPVGRVSPPAATVEVTAQSVAEDADVLSVEAWTNVGRSLVNASAERILIYARVTLGRLTPVLGAKVVALIRPPGNSSQEFVVQLYDRGTGDPDVTKADGIYSAYFTQAVPEPGHYAVTIQVTDDSRRASIPIRRTGFPAPTACCGSSVPYQDTKPIQPFRRIVSGPSFMTIGGPEPSEDIYPPGRITDLRVERTSNATFEAELSWTAPGSDYDRGTASSYQIRCYTDRGALNDSLAILVHASLSPTPLPVGSVQRTSVAVPWPNQLFYYAVVAVDASGLTGRISNIVPVYIYEAPPSTTTTSSTTGPPSDADYVSGDGLNGTIPIRHVGGLTEHQMYAVAGGVSSFVLLLVILSIAVCLCRRKKTKPVPTKSTGIHGIQVEPMKRSLPDVSLVTNNNNRKTDQQISSGASENVGSSGADDRPVYKIYVNNAYIQEEDGDLKIVTPDGRVISSTSGHNTLPRGRSASHQLDRTPTFLSSGIGASDLMAHHCSLPRSIKSPATQRASKVLTNGSIMHSGSQVALTTGSTNLMTANSSDGTNGLPSVGVPQQMTSDGTSISSKPSVSSEDTGIEVSDHLTMQTCDSRDSGDGLMVLDPNSLLLGPIMPPPGFGPAHLGIINGYLPMMSNAGSSLLPPLPPSPASRDARVVRLPSYNQADWMTAASRKPLMMMEDGSSCYDRELLATGSSAGSSSGSTPQISPPPPSAFERPPPVVRRKKRHISFV